MRVLALCVFAIALGFSTKCVASPGLMESISVEIPGSGHLSVRLRWGKTEEISSNFFTERGAHRRTHRLTPAAYSVRGLRGSRAKERGGIAATFHTPSSESDSAIFIPLDTRRIRNGRRVGREHELWIFLNREGVALSRRLRRASLGKTSSTLNCKTQGVPLSRPAQITTARGASVNAARSVSIYLHADSRFAALYGEYTSSVLATALRSVNEIYQPQLGISLRYSGATIFSDPTADPFLAEVGYLQLLDNYASWVAGQSLPEADNYHLLTSRRGYSEAIGLAYLGSLCGAPSYGFGWSDYANGYYDFVVTLAHELGHSHGANHDLSDQGSIMSITVANTTTPYFSALSVSEIENNLAGDDSCLLDSEGGELPEPDPGAPFPGDDDQRNIRITLKVLAAKRGGTLSGRVRSVLSGPLANRIVEIRRYDTQALVKSVTTSSNGRYIARIKRKGIYYTVDQRSNRTSPRSLRVG